MRLQWLPALILSGWEVPGRDFRDTPAYENVYHWTADQTRLFFSEWFCEETGAAVAVRSESQADRCDFIMPHKQLEPGYFPTYLSGSKDARLGL